MAKKNYNKMYNEPKEDVIPEVVSFVEETAEVENKEPEIQEVPVLEVKKGIITGCIKLNVRKAPKTNAEILTTLDAGTTVIILDEIGDFYKIGNPDGSEYCMKKYISVK